MHHWQYEKWCFLYFMFVREACVGVGWVFYAFGCTWEGSLIKEALWFYFPPYSFRRGQDNALMINWVFAELLNSISGGKSPFLANFSHHREFTSGHLCGPVDIWNKSALTGQDPFRIAAPPRGQSPDEWFISGRIKCSFPAETRCMLKIISGKTLVGGHLKYAPHGLTWATMCWARC